MGFGFARVRIKGIRISEGYCSTLILAAFPLISLLSVLKLRASKLTVVLSLIFLYIYIYIPYCYYYKRVLILANIGDLVITAKFCARY